MKTKPKGKYFPDRHHVLEVLSFLLNKKKQKKPASLIRLGDAEGRFLGYPEFVSKTGDDKHELDYVLQLELGRTNFSENVLYDLSLQMRSAVKEADIVGLPRAKQYANISYDYVFEAIERFQLTSPNQIYPDAAIHRYLQFGLFYKQLLDNLDFVGLITGRNQLGSIIQKTFNVEKIVQYLIPAEAIHPGELKGEHYPDRFISLKNEIEVPYKGAIFLVGAGYLGKIYCHWIQKAGGIAIDIGSICDSWASEGRLQHDYHKIKHYDELSPFSLENSVQRYNQACDHFDMDSIRLTNAHLTQFISENGNLL